MINNDDPKKLYSSYLHSTQNSRAVLVQLRTYRCKLDNFMDFYMEG